jgi:hypothetical protein
MGDGVVMVIFLVLRVFSKWVVSSCSWCWMCVTVLFGWSELGSFEVTCIGMVFLMHCKQNDGTKWFFLCCIIGLSLLQKVNGFVDSRYTIWEECSRRSL